MNQKILAKIFDALFALSLFAVAYAFPAFTVILTPTLLLVLYSAPNPVSVGGMKKYLVFALFLFAGISVGDMLIDLVLQMVPGLSGILGNSIAKFVGEASVAFWLYKKFGERL